MATSSIDRAVFGCCHPFGVSRAVIWPGPPGKREPVGEGGRDGNSTDGVAESGASGARFASAAVLRCDLAVRAPAEGGVVEVAGVPLSVAAMGSPS